MNKRIVKHSETHGIFLAKDFRTPPTPPSLSFKMYTKFLNFLGSKHENRTFVIFFFWLVPPPIFKLLDYYL